MVASATMYHRVETEMVAEESGLKNVAISENSILIFLLLLLLIIFLILIFILILI